MDDIKQTTECEDLQLICILGKNYECGDLCSRQ